MNGYPKIFNIEMDPGEQLNVAFLFPWVLDPALEGGARIRTLGEGASESARAERDPVPRRRLTAKNGLRLSRPHAASL